MGQLDSSSVGYLAFATDLESPWGQITASGLGIGAGLTLDEFALGRFSRPRPRPHPAMLVIARASGARDEHS